MKETTAYKSEFLKMECPYCQADNYLDVDDDYGEGRIPDKGRIIKCAKCTKEFRLIP